MKKATIESFEKIYRKSPQYIVRAPGRVNLIGDHTDYNDGFVLPLAIDYAVWIALSPSEEDTVSLYSMDFNQTAAFDLKTLQHSQAGWVEYVKGVAFHLQQEGHQLKGWQGVISANLPIGASLSSSAALELAALQASVTVSQIDILPRQKALIGQRAENEWIGVQCGIMDQLASACGVEDHALFIDCRTLEIKPVRIPDDCLIAILDTKTRRELTQSAYNQRRKECEQAADFFRITKLRDLPLANLEANRAQLNDTVAKRALHVVTENQRTELTAQALEQNDLTTVGQLLSKSHQSLRDLYQVSSPALDQIVDSAMESPGCYGARMTGAGFGGCAVALIEKKSASAFVDEVLRRYPDKSGIQAEVYLTNASRGAETVIL